MKVQSECYGNVYKNTYKSSEIIDRHTAVLHGISACWAVPLKDKLVCFYNGDENISKMFAHTRNCRELVKACSISPATHVEATGYYEKHKFKIIVNFNTQEIFIECNREAKEHLPILEFFFLVNKK